jgi:hypothetical protein
MSHQTDRRLMPQGTSEKMGDDLQESDLSDPQQRTQPFQNKWMNKNISS